MSILGAYRASGVVDASGATSDRIINISGFQPSGLSNGNLLGAALYVWSGSSYTNGSWVPLRVSYLK